MIITLIAISCVLQVNDSTSTTLLERTGWAAQRHAQLNERVKQQGGSADVVFVGDSITQGWEGAGAQVWEEQIAPLHAINLGIGGDRTEHVLWRFDNGNLEGLSPQVAVVMIGTNNFGQANSDSEDEVLDGIVAVVDVLQARLPCTHVLLLDIFPRGETFNNRRGSILQVNQALQGLYEHDERVTFLEIGHRFVEDDGSIDPKIMPDYLHLSEEGYRRWANSIMPAINAIQHGGSGMPKKQLQQKPNQKPDLSRGGPWDFDVLVYQVDVRGQSSQLGTFERAGVPSIASMEDGRLIAAHQWFPEDNVEAFDTIAVRFSSDDGKSWTKPTSMVFDGLDPEARYPFDPTLVVLEDGRVRLYFTYMVGSRIFEEATPGISSAISDDGIHFVKEEGMRFAMKGEPVIDCSVCKIGTLWHLISPKHDNTTPRAYHATSADGLHFEEQNQLSLDKSFKWLGCMVNQGRTCTFYGTQQHGAGSRQGGIPVATTTNGSKWKRASSLRIPGADPGVVVLEDGSMVVVTTGPPRQGTTSHQRMLDGKREGPGQQEPPKRGERRTRPQRR